MIHRKTIELLESEQTELYPVSPSLIPKANRWLEQARELLSHRLDHEATRIEIGQREDAVKAKAGQTDSDGSLAGLVDDLLVEFGHLEKRAIEVESRVERAKAILSSSHNEANQEKWRQCIDAVAKSPKYNGLKLTPQVGLIPLGESELSGLWEFLHIDSGGKPQFDANRWEGKRWEGAHWNRKTGEWIVGRETGIILVLLPGGTFSMGARVGPANRNPEKSERDVHDVTLEPFFISKFEMTQAQWARCREGENPSWYFPGTERAMDREGAKPITWSHPVESVNWETAQQTLERIFLTLPTESQWEYATRGGTKSAYSCGDTVVKISFVANLLGQEMPEEHYHNGRAPLNDGYITTSPVGAFGPNPFGLYDVHGNLSEWCLDGKVDNYAISPPVGGNGLRVPKSATDLRIHRGGNYKIGLGLLRSSARNWSLKHQKFRNAGIRPCRVLVR